MTTRGFSGFGRYNDVLALLMALMFILMLLVRGVGGPVRLPMGSPVASCTTSVCIDAERMA